MLLLMQTLAGVYAIDLCFEIATLTDAAAATADADATSSASITQQNTNIMLFIH